MKRFLAAAAVAAGLALAGCGAAQGPANPQDPLSAAGMSGGRPSHVTPSPAPREGRQWLPVLTARQVADGRLLPQKWTLLRVAQGGTVAEIGYFAGPCLSLPEGVLVSQSGRAVTMSLEAPSPRLAADCAPVLVVEVAWVHIPGLAGRTLSHAPPAS